MQRFPVPAL